MKTRILHDSFEIQLLQHHQAYGDFDYALPMVEPDTWDETCEIQTLYNKALEHIKDKPLHEKMRQRWVSFTLDHRPMDVVAYVKNLKWLDPNSSNALEKEWAQITTTLSLKNKAPELQCLQLMYHRTELAAPLWQKRVKQYMKTENLFGMLEDEDITALLEHTSIHVGKTYAKHVALRTAEWISTYPHSLNADAYKKLKGLHAYVVLFLSGSDFAYNHSNHHKVMNDVLPHVSSSLTKNDMINFCHVLAYAKKNNDTILQECYSNWVENMDCDPITLLSHTTTANVLHASLSMYLSLHSQYDYNDVIVMLEHLNPDIKTEEWTPELGF